MSTSALGSHHPVSTLALVLLRIRAVWLSLRHPIRRRLLAPGEVDSYPWTD